MAKVKKGIQMELSLVMLTLLYQCMSLTTMVRMFSYSSYVILGVLGSGQVIGLINQVYGRLS